MADTTSTPSPAEPSSRAAVLALLAGLDARLRALERPDDKTALKKLTDNAGAVALFLGLVLTFASLYDVFVRKPEADRISAIGQFNQAVNAAAKVRQDLVQQTQSGDASTRLAMMSLATPIILNNVSTAKALLPTLDDRDVGIPQLIILINESSTAGDATSTADFVERAVNKKDATPYMKSEAKRYQGRFLFYTGRPKEGRAAYQQALALLGDSPAAAAPRAYDLSDLLTLEFSYGECANVESDIQLLFDTINTQSVPAMIKSQLSESVVLQLRQFEGKKCPMPKNIGLLHPA